MLLLLSGHSFIWQECFFPLFNTVSALHLRYTICILYIMNKYRTRCSNTVLSVTHLVEAGECKDSKDQGADILFSPHNMFYLIIINLPHPPSQTTKVFVTFLHIFSIQCRCLTSDTEVNHLLTSGVCHFQICGAWQVSLHQPEDNGSHIPVKVHTPC